MTASPYLLGSSPNGNDEIRYVLDGGVKYLYHPNGGGLVAETAKVDSSVRVLSPARVKPGAVVTGDVILDGTTDIGRGCRIDGTEGRITLTNVKVLPGAAVLKGSFFLRGGFIIRSSKKSITIPVSS